MDQVQILKSKAHTANYAFLKLLQKYNFDGNTIHYIFEGFDDQSFYFNYLQSRTSNYETYISYGKKNSIELYNNIDWQKYKKSRIIIFIDRDFDRLLGNPIPIDNNIYETTFYSIENYICSKLILKRMISEILHFHDGNVINEIAEKYELELEKFHKNLFPILVWIFLIRKNNIKANLNMIDMSKIFQINEELDFLCIMKKNKLTYLEKVTNTTTPNTKISDIRKIIEIFNSTLSCKEYLRGKFELWFLITFFNKINKYLLTNQGHDSKMRTSINVSNSIEIIGPRVKIPNRLLKFLNKLD